LISADDNVAQAGYTEKFKTWIIIYHNGSSEWISPVSFKSTCVLDVTYFPYDEHRCDMIFGSLTSDKTLMDIETEETRVGKGDDNDVDKQFGMYKINAMALFVKILKSTDFGLASPFLIISARSRKRRRLLNN